MSSALVTSAGTASTSACVSRRISSAAASRSAGVRAQIVTLASSRASASAEALPRPLLDAATTATLPFSPRSTHLSHLHAAVGPSPHGLYRGTCGGPGGERSLERYPRPPRISDRTSRCQARSRWLYTACVVAHGETPSSSRRTPRRLA